MNWSELLAGGVIGALLSGVLQYFVMRAYDYWESLKGEWHGTWYEVLPSYQGLPERWDLLSLTQRGNRVRGTAKRIVPVDEKKRRWKFEGYASGNKLIGFFYLTNLKIDPSSYIPVVMLRDRHSRHECVWRGFYLRPEFMSEDDILEGMACGGKMWWQRSKPSQRYFESPLESQSEQVHAVNLLPVEKTNHEATK